jgi:hypothetical protein
MRPPALRVVVLVAVVLVVGSPALARVTTYNNFGPGHDGWDYNWGLGWTVAGENVPAQFGVEQAMAFEATASGTLSDIWVAVWYVPLDSQPDLVTVYLARNPSGLPPRPEDILEQWTITQFGSWSQWNPPQHLTGNGSTIITQGDSYWLWAVGGPTTWCGWCLNLDPALTCPHTMRREGEGWLPVGNETASAFRVDLAEDPASMPESGGRPVLSELMARPNPARSAVEVTCRNPPAGPLTMRLIDSAGRIACTAEGPESAGGERIWKIDAARLPRGIYFIVADGPGQERLSGKLVLAP